MSIETYPAQNVQLGSKNKSKTRGRISAGYIAFPYMAVELCAVYLLGLIIAYFYVGQTLNMPDFYPLYVTPLLLAPIVIGVMFNRNGFYDVVNLQRPTLVALNLMKTMATAFVLLVLLGFIAGIASHYSRIWYFSWSFGSIALVIFMRGFLGQILSKLSNLEIRLSRVAIFGDIDAVQRTAEDLRLENSSTEIVGLFTDGTTSGNGMKGDLTSLVQFGQETTIDRIIIAKDSMERTKTTKLLEELSILPCEIVIHPGFLGDAAKVSGITSVQATPAIRVQKTPISDWGLLAKSIGDKMMAAAGIIILAPLFAFVAVAIKLDSKGPVFFKQIRHGYNQREISVWKFRTMTVMENGDTFKQASRNDSRITRIGGFLRKSSIDELPQLLNVLNGEMSIVGPRPHPVSLNDDFSKRLLRYNNRHKVKPGITGWAQINGYRGPTDQPGQMDKRVEYDLDYIENWSFWFDVKIILATPYYGLISKNAF